jgi:ADP-ribose pyrophosphatase
MKRILKTNLIFKGRLLNLRTQKRRLPNGYIVNLEIIRHPGAVLIVPFLSKDKMIILRQYRPVVNMYVYELPAGTLNKGEGHILCAKREIIEETGYSAARLSKLGVIYPAPGYSTEKIIIYRAEGLKRQRVDPEMDEIISTRIITKKEAVRLFKSGKIVDAKTICALALCGWLT